MNRILVVDDEIEVCKVLKTFLVSKGYEVDCAMNGLDALKMVEDLQPQVVLLDLMMPEMDGLKTLRHIKKLSPDTGVIVITALHHKQLGQEIMRLGALDYITKPIDLSYLETSVLAGFFNR